MEDIDIARQAKLQNITNVAEKLGIEENYLEQYGKYKAKIDYNLLKESDKKDGKLIFDGEINDTIEKYEETFKKYLEEKKLEAKDIFQFKYNIVVSKNDPLALKSSVTTEDLSNYIIISHADPYVPSLPAHDLQKEDMGYNNERHIFVYERASQLELLSKVKSTCMFVSPMPKHLLNIYGLKEIKCSDKVGMYKDVLIYRKKQKLDSFDELFINQLENSIKEH